jgi:hypothetical protein
MKKKFKTPQVACKNKYKTFFKQQARKGRI